jgi:hypothetical protein
MRTVLIVKMWFTSAAILCFLPFVAKTQPVNDNCSGAIQVYQTHDPLWNNVNAIGATQSMAPCGNNNPVNNDVWFYFVATDTVASLKFRNTSFYTGSVSDNVEYELFTGNCNNLTSIRCDIERKPNVTSAFKIKQIVPGQTYYLRMYNIGQMWMPEYQFCILKEQLYDQCGRTPELLMNNDNVIDTLSFASTYYAAVSQAPWVNYPCFVTGGTDDFWLKFTATDSFHTIWLTPTSYECPGCSPYTCYSILYKGDCNSLVALPGYCDLFYLASPHYINTPALVPGDTYFLRVYSNKPGGSWADFYVGVGPLGAIGYIPPLAIGNTTREKNELTVIPNPTTTQLNIRMEAAAGDGIINIVDITGKELYQRTFKGGLSVDVSGYAPGIYFVRYSGSDGVIAAKFIKQ